MTIPALEPYRVVIRAASGGPLPIPVPEPVPKADRARTIAHLTDTVLTALGHATRHTAAAQQAQADPVAREFNTRHAAKHLAEAVEHQRHLISVLAAYDPAVGREMNLLHGITQPGSDVLPAPPRSRSREDDYAVTPPDCGPPGVFVPPGRSPEPA